MYFMAESVPLNRPPETALYELDLVTKAISPILRSSDSFTPYRFALTNVNKRFAIAGESERNTIEFRIFEVDSGKLSEPFASLPLGFTEINWYDESQLVVHHLNKLYLLSLDGELTKLPIDSFMRIFNPVVAPQSGNIAMTVTEQDRDLVLIDMDSQREQRVINSTGEDHLGRISANARLLAYVSARSGVQQVMIAADGKTLQVFPNPENLPVNRAPVWDKSGRRLAFAQGQNLHVFDTRTQALQTIAMPDWFTSVLDWYEDGERLLLATKKDNQSWFEVFDLQSQTSQRITETGVNYYARLDRNDALVFSVDDTVYWGENRYQHPTFTQSHGRYFPSGNTLIYQAGDSVYAFDGQRVSTLLATLPNDAQQLIDANANQLLFESSVTARARIVKLD
ncbi:hypothetical protein BFC18_18300 [Alteromonas confluentis]|uniref:Uncharacterized protein n=2 Tax=Alteromonas confluentis TaxID=1656094 RepID=A0A1E7Z759_9ALTE|nr:hypothetical protein BFC18_18300 [Alteromonas confluentis]